MRTAKNELLQSRITFSYKENVKDIPKEPTIQSALSIFKKIKECERLDDKGEVDYKKELLEAKKDLEFIFNIPIKEINAKTKNNLYMEHQSLMVNAIYIMLNKDNL